MQRRIDVRKWRDVINGKVWVIEQHEDGSYSAQSADNSTSALSKQELYQILRSAY